MLELPTLLAAGAPISMGEAYVGAGAEKLSYRGVLYTSICSGRSCGELPDMRMVNPSTAATQ